jgi:hypothetical protein
MTDSVSSHPFVFSKAALAALCALPYPRPKPKILVVTGTTNADKLAAGTTGLVSIPGCMTVAEAGGAIEHDNIKGILVASGVTPSASAAAVAPWALTLAKSTAFPTAGGLCTLLTGPGGSVLPAVLPPGVPSAAANPAVPPIAPPSPRGSAGGPAAGGSSTNVMPRVFPQSSPRGAPPPKPPRPGRT